MHTCSKCKIEIGGSEKPVAYNTEGKWTCPKHTPINVIRRAEGWKVLEEWEDDDKDLIQAKCYYCPNMVSMLKVKTKPKCSECFGMEMQKRKLNKALQD